MNIQLYEPELSRGGGIFSYLYQALMKCKGASAAEGKRPLPKITEPREHSSAWARFGAWHVFFDMSDHAFLFDLDALKRCDVYFKANLNRNVMRKALPESQGDEGEGKVVPLLFFAGHLDFYKADTLYNRLYPMLKSRRWDLCHIVGVYENCPQRGEKSIFLPEGPPPDPGRYHFWVRYHIQEALKSAGIKGYYRLTSRWMKEIEDNRLVFPSLSQRGFKNRMLASRMTVVNILPHALLPWKAGESLALGRPLLLERAPLVEIPEPFTLREGEHYLELLPDFGSFSETAPIEDPASYRILENLDLQALQERAAWLAGVLSDSERMALMRERSLKYSRDVLVPETVADYVCDQVRRVVHGQR